MHLVAIQTQHDEIRRVIVLPVSIDVGDFQHGRNAKTTVCAAWIVSRRLHRLVGAYALCNAASTSDINNGKCPDTTPHTIASSIES